MMASGPSPDELAERAADESLLSEDPVNLPAAIGRPAPIPESRTRARLVGLGATLTGVTLIAGVALLVLGVVEALSNGFGLTSILALVVGIALVSTHWGWVHVAEASADAIENRSNRGTLAEREQWLRTIEPYTRYEVTTIATDDGSITIDRFAYRPVLSGDRSFRFSREVELSEVHSGEEPAAAVAEHAELLRRQASFDTQRERERYEAAADASERALLGRDDDEERRAALRAASAALSEQINSNLRDPPLTE